MAMGLTKEDRQFLKEIQEQRNDEFSLNGLGDQSESEITWIKLHQMFDK